MADRSRSAHGDATPAQLASEGSGGSPDQVALGRRLGRLEPVGPPLAPKERIGYPPGTVTIAVAIRTADAVVFAADSKLTTRGVAGLGEDGKPIWVEQTFDNATKVVHDRSRTAMAMVAGPANIGRIQATDYISKTNLENIRNSSKQEEEIEKLSKNMMEEKRQYWATTQVPPEEWPGPTVILAAPSSEGRDPRAWRIRLDGLEPRVSEILTEPDIKLEGSYDETFGLLFGYEFNVLEGIAAQLGVEVKRVLAAARDMKVLRPYDKLNLWAMPLQDAIDLAVFLANVQVQMDRFLPGTPACGGPIDVMVLRMAPDPGIVIFPGKTLHHPGLR